MPQETPVHSCPFADRTNASSQGEPHIEGRFTALETKVSGLQVGMENMQRSVAEGFKAVFTKIDLIVTSRSAATLPYIGMFLVVLGMASAFVYHVFVGQADAIRDIKLIATEDLKDVNKRLYESQYERGKSDALAAATTIKLNELDNKLQNETKLVADRIDEKIRALDEKLQIESRLVAATAQKQMEDQAVYAAEMRAWQLTFVEKMAHSQGEQDAEMQNIKEEQRTIEGRQYINSATISGLDATHKPSLPGPPKPPHE